MNQKLSISLLCSGLATFLTSLGELLAAHKSWSELSTPSEIGHIVIITAAFIVTLTGALGTQLPRSKNERVTDIKLQELNRSNNE